MKKKHCLSLLLVFFWVTGCNLLDPAATPGMKISPSPSYKAPTHTYADQQNAMAESKENFNEDIYGWYYAEATPVSEVADFLIVVNPPPGATLAIADSPIIEVIFWGDDIDQGCATVGEEMYERFKIFVDGSLMTRDQLGFTSMLEIGAFLEPNGALKCTFDNGPFSVFAHVDLEEGRHAVRFLITRNTGETLEYEWEFVLTH